MAVIESVAAVTLRKHDTFVKDNTEFIDNDVIQLHVKATYVDGPTVQ